MDERKRTAIIYAFDGTLVSGNLQEQSFIPGIGMSREAFWAEVKSQVKEHDADEILVYMHLTIEKATEAGEPVSARRCARWKPTFSARRSPAGSACSRSPSPTTC